MTTSVFVSGATGFIAQHIVKELIHQGYKVVGSVRSAAKGDKLRRNLASGNFTYEVIKDIAEPGAFDKALLAHPEVTVFMHTASPFHFKVVDMQKEMMAPAVDGTRNALSAIKKNAPQITNVVVTSSLTAESSVDPEEILEGRSRKGYGWEYGFGGYVASKTVAEKLVWEFVRDEKPNFAVNVVSPACVFGPQAFDNECGTVLNTSNQVLKEFVRTKPGRSTPHVPGDFVDVRDVVRAHIDAFTSDRKNHRYVLDSGYYSSQDILDILNGQFPELKGKIATGRPGTGYLGSRGELDTDTEYVSLKKSVVDTVEQILRVGKTSSKS